MSHDELLNQIRSMKIEEPQEKDGTESHVLTLIIAATAIVSLIILFLK